MVPPGERFAVGLTEKVLSLGSTWFCGCCLPFGIGAAGAAPGNVAGSLGAYLAASLAPRPVRVFGQRWISERAKVVQSVLLGMLSHLLQVHRNRRHVRQPSLLRCPLPPVARSAHRLVDRVLIEDVLEFVVRFASARRASGEAVFVPRGEGFQGGETALEQNRGDVRVAPRRASSCRERSFVPTSFDGTHTHGVSESCWCDMLVTVCVRLPVDAGRAQSSTGGRRRDLRSQR